VALALAGCGAAPADLFHVQRTGAIPGARLTLRVSDDGQATCNGRRRDVPSRLLILSRVLARDLQKPAQRRLVLPARPNSILRFRIRTEEGTVAFSDTSRGQPPVFYRAAELVREIAIDACGLPR
jgi:hypothetical protein